MVESSEVKKIFVKQASSKTLIEKVDNCLKSLKIKIDMPINKFIKPKDQNDVVNKNLWNYW